MDIEYYDFKQHIDSVEWIYSLPKGLVTEKVDLRYSTPSITKLENGYEIYIGPSDRTLAGDAILIKLDKDFRLNDYQIERLAPLPFK